MRAWLLITGISGALAVMAGAFGYHWLAYDDSLQQDFFNLGVQYHMWHTLALLGVAVFSASGRGDRHALAVAGWCFTGGILMFSGTLYFYGFTEILLPVVAPVGGTLLILGWLALAYAGAKQLKSD